MPGEKVQDYYDVLQVSTNAEPDTINRVFRLLAQRFHPDNQQTGDEERFRTILEAYSVLSDPAQRASYDVRHERQQKERWRLVTEGAKLEDNFEMEKVSRLAILEVLYTKRRTDQENSGLSLLDLEKMIGRPREHLEFTIWYLLQKQLIKHEDHGTLAISVLGVEFLEDSYQTKHERKRLEAGDPK